MNTAFRKSFAQDVKKLKNQSVLKRIHGVVEKVEAADSLDEIANLKNLSGAENCYRIRIGDYRLGIFVGNDTVEFVRCLHRRELYRFFP
jgi:mRNA interferase RelE/StbE